MNILVTGAKGMVGTALVNNLKNIRDHKNQTRPNICIDEIYEYDMDSTKAELEYYCERADFVFHLAGVNRPENPDEFMRGNFGFTSELLACLKKYQNKATIMLSSPIQATLAGRFGDSEYGRSKLAGEQLIFDYGKETGAKIAVYRFPNLMGHSRPKYNSAVSTFCWAVANDEPYTVTDRSTELELLYIDDLVEGMFDLLEGKEQHCTFDGVETVLCDQGPYCCVPVTHKVTLGEIVDLLEQFKMQPQTLLMPKMPDGSFAKKLFSLYLTYLPKEKFAYPLKMNMDDRGSFTELVHTQDCGQVSINISKPGITKGQHWHNSKWELFIVVAGHGLIQERNINTGEMVEFEVSGDKIEAVYMIPGWTHNIINLSETENLVTVMTCNEVFDKRRPDTFGEAVSNVDMITKYANDKVHKMKKYKEVCDKLKGKNVQMSNVRSALIEVAGGSREDLLQIKAEAQEKGQVSTGLMTGSSMLIAAITLFVTMVVALTQVLLQYSEVDKKILISVLLFCFIAYLILLSIDTLISLVRGFMLRNEVTWSRYVLIEIDELLETEPYKIKMSEE